MGDPSTGIISCIKLNPSAPMLFGEVFRTVGKDADTFRPIMDTPNDDNQSNVGIVVQDSDADNPVVLIKFTGLATVRVDSPFPTRGDQIGTESGSKKGHKDKTGIGTVLISVDTTQGFSFVRLSGAGPGEDRWITFNPTP